MTVIQITTLIHAPIDLCFDLSLNIDLELEAVNGLRAVGGITSGSIRPFERVRWQSRQFGILVTHESEITKFVKPDFFQDTMVEGIFSSFQHDHLFVGVGARSTEMRDVLRFSMPGWLLGVLSERLAVRPRLLRLLAARNAIIKGHAEAAKS